MLRVFGPVTVGGTVPRSAAQRVILAAMVLDAGSVVSADRLADLVWGDEQPGDPVGALQSHVSRLRRSLPGGITVEASGHGYVLDLAADGSDVGRFEQACERAASAADPAEAAAAAAEAVELWGGRPFADLDDPRATAESSRLEELLRVTRERRAEALRRLGRGDDAVAELEAVLADDPLRERTVETLMRTLVETGRKTDALAAFGRLREQLVEQTGLDPGPELRGLETAILTEEVVTPPVVAAPAASTAAPAEPTAGAFRVVPASAFIGREHDLALVVDLVGEHRLVTIVGPGGAGKTRLSLHAAERLAAESGSEVAVVELAGVADAGQLAESVATALAVPARAGVTATERLIRAMAGCCRVLVLDNCEHVIEAAAELVDDLLRGTDAVTILATSRELLDVDGEHVVRLGPLPVDRAAELFVDRVETQSGTVLPPEAASLVREICAAVDGLPLAVELAAALLRSLTLTEVADALRRPLDVLQRGRRTADERHRSLRSLVEWSVRDLDDRQRDVFVATAAFAGPFSARALSVVCDRPEADVVVVLADLIDRSLVVSSRARDRTTYATLATIRAYASELLRESGHENRIRDRHAGLTLGWVEQMARDMTAWGAVEVDSVAADLAADLRVVHRRFVDADDVDRALRFAVALHYPAFYRMQSEVYGWIRESAERFESSGHRDVQAALASASVGAWQSGDLDAAADFAARAAAAVLPDVAQGAGPSAANARSDVVSFLGDPEESYRQMRAAEKASRESGIGPRRFNDLSDLAIAAGCVGRFDEARDALEEADRLAQAGPTSASAWAAYARGESLADDDPDTAVVALTEAVDLAHRCGASFIVGVAGLTRAGLQIRGGDPVLAVPGVIDLVEHWRRGGAHVQQWITLRSVVELLVRLRAHREAGLLLGAVEAEESSGQLSGADAERMADARRQIEEHVADHAAVLTAWSGRDLDMVVVDVLAELATRS